MAQTAVLERADLGIAEDPASSPRAARAMIRAGRHTGHTAGLAMGHLQGNLAILPKDWALAFAAFCHRNPKPCPLVAMSDPGDPRLPQLGADIDIRTDVPSYNVYRDGKLAEQVTDLTKLWRDDLVTFVLGCSFSFEEALLHDGIPLRHFEEQLTVSMYRTTIETVPSGPFHGGMVVSMRPMTPKNALRAVEITSRYPAAHGAPIHLGDPAAIGIADLDKPDWGDPQPLRAGEIPVFWACGVTPQFVLQNARPPLCITHTPGCMLIADHRSTKVQMAWAG
jgi:uncharacterized protein YcsI (UPF0317 family)